MVNCYISKIFTIKQGYWGLNFAEVISFGIKQERFGEVFFVEIQSFQDTQFLASLNWHIYCSFQCKFLKQCGFCVNSRSYEHSWCSGWPCWPSSCPTPTCRWRPPGDRGTSWRVFQEFSNLKLYTNNTLWALFWAIFISLACLIKSEQSFEQLYSL